jgi:hypothetical protein
MSSLARRAWRFMGAHVTPGLGHSRPATPDNARLLLALLNEFGFEQSSFKETDFLEPEQIIRLGRVPSRIDLLTSLTGVTTDQAVDAKVSAIIDGIPVFVLGRDASIRNKRAVGQPQDLADLSVLAA